MGCQCSQMTPDRVVNLEENLKLNGDAENGNSIINANGNEKNDVLQKEQIKQEEQKNMNSLTEKKEKEEKIQSDQQKEVKNDVSDPDKNKKIINSENEQKKEEVDNKNIKAEDSVKKNEEMKPSEEIKDSIKEEAKENKEAKDSKEIKEIKENQEIKENNNMKDLENTKKDEVKENIQDNKENLQKPEIKEIAENKDNKEIIENKIEDKNKDIKDNPSDNKKCEEIPPKQLENIENKIIDNTEKKLPEINEIVKNDKEKNSIPETKEQAKVELDKKDNEKDLLKQENKEIKPPEKADNQEVNAEIKYQEKKENQLPSNNESSEPKINNDIKDKPEKIIENNDTQKQDNNVFYNTNTTNNKEYDVSNYPKDVLELINIIRNDPPKFAEEVEKAISKIKNIKGKLVYCDKLKVCLNKGEVIFREVIEILKNTPHLEPLQFREDITIFCPTTEEEIKNLKYFQEKIIEKKKQVNLDVYFKDAVQNPYISVLLIIVDDSIKNIGKKRAAILNPELKYIGISSTLINNSFCAYFTFSK